MPIVFAALTPHPPIIIPEIGKEKIKKVQKTVSALNLLSQKLEESEAETLIIISPHNLIYPNQFNICGMKKLIGDFSTFGAPEIKLQFSNNSEIVNKIDELCLKNQIPALLYDNGTEFFQLDHGSLVPLYYLVKELSTNIKVIPMAYSNLSTASHFSFGQTLAEMAKAENERIAIIASGDLSHRLFQDEFPGKLFDKQIISLLEHKDYQKIIYMDEDLIEDAGECGYRSLTILLGALDNLKNTPKILSYEGPFGVGYSVVNFEIQ